MLFPFKVRSTVLIPAHFDTAHTQPPVINFVSGVPNRVPQCSRYARALRLARLSRTSAYMPTLLYASLGR